MQYRKASKKLKKGRCILTHEKSNVFIINGDLYVKIKETYTAASNRSTLAMPKVVFKKKSNNRKIM